MEYICRVWGKQIKIIGWFLEMEKKKKSPRRLKFNTVQTVVIGFFGVILGGGILLSLPICNQKPIEFIDALFTSVSSVCVTGLVTIVPAEQFTLLGKIILLLLIQVGGLGVIACMSAFFPFIGKKDQYERKNHDPTGIWTGYAFRSCKVRDPYFKRNVFGRGDRRGTFFAPVYS